MTRLEGISEEELREALEETDDKKGAVRLFAAIANKNGISQKELSEWLDVERKTIYNWLTGLEESSELTEAAKDDKRTGRKPKLNQKQQEELENTLQKTPEEVGYDQPAWTPELVRHHIKETYGEEYSLLSCRRLMKKAGLSYQKPRRKNAEADPEERQEFKDELKKREQRWTQP